MDELFNMTFLCHFLPRIPQVPGPCVALWVKGEAKITFATGFVVVPASLLTLENCRSAMILCE
jgi:hypothetical protein